MEWSTVQTDWGAMQQQILTRWPELEETEVSAVDGNREAFLTLLAETPGRDREIAESELDEFLEGFEPLDARMDETNDDRAIRDSARMIPDGEDVYDDDRAFGGEEQD